MSRVGSISKRAEYGFDGGFSSIAGSGKDSSCHFHRVAFVAQPVGRVAFVAQPVGTVAFISEQLRLVKYLRKPFRSR